MATQKKKFLVTGWVQVQVYAEIEATNQKAAKKIVKDAHGSGVPDAFNWEESSWCSPVTVDSITEESRGI